MLLNVFKNTRKIKSGKRRKDHQLQSFAGHKFAAYDKITRSSLLVSFDAFN